MDKNFQLKDLISFDDVVTACGVNKLGVTWRKLNYYKSLGLLPKAERLAGDKRGYYPYIVIFYLELYLFLQNNLGYTLQEIKQLMNESGIPAETFLLYVIDSYKAFLIRVFEKYKIEDIIDPIQFLQFANFAYSFMLKEKVDSFSKKGKKQGEKIIDDMAVGAFKILEISLAEKEKE